jgi:hypothetical protein
MRVELMEPQRACGQILCYTLGQEASENRVFISLTSHRNSTVYRTSRVHSQLYNNA